MHEFSMTNELVKNVIKEAKKHSADKVLEVYLEVGKLTFLGLEQMRFCYEVISKDSILEGSNLIIDQVDGAVKCKQCGYEGVVNYFEEAIYHIMLPTLSCPKCGEITEVIKGRECIIKRIVFEALESV